MEQNENGGEGSGVDDEDEDDTEDGDEEDKDDAGGGTPPRRRARRKSVKATVDKSGDEQVRCPSRFKNRLDIVGFTPLSRGVVANGAQSRYFRQYLYFWHCGTQEQIAVTSGLLIGPFLPYLLNPLLCIADRGSAGEKTGGGSPT